MGFVTNAEIDASLVRFVYYLITIALATVWMLGGMNMESFKSAVIIGGSIWSYFLPVEIAARSKKVNQGTILTANLFIGWTVIGWIVCLIWSLHYNQHELTRMADQKQQ